ncbi:hypothetical protein FOZ62_026419, partial [Perkinsus olseni]
MDSAPAVEDRSGAAVVLPGGPEASQSWSSPGRVKPSKGLPSADEQRKIKAERISIGAERHVKFDAASEPSRREWQGRTRKR